MQESLKNNPEEGIFEGYTDSLENFEDGQYGTEKIQYEGVSQEELDADKKELMDRIRENSKNFKPQPKKSTMEIFEMNKKRSANGEKIY